MKNRPRHLMRVQVAVLSVLATVAATLVVVGTQPQPAQAATDLTFFVDSADPKLDDAAVGDGVCATSASNCTLRAAMQEANATPAGQTVTITPADGFSATIANSGSTAADAMFTSPIGSSGDQGAYYLATRPMIIDLQNRLGMQTTSAINLAAFYINGPGVEIRNFSGQRLLSRQSLFVVGPDADGTIIQYGLCADPVSTMARCVEVAGGANLTINDIVVDSLRREGIHFSDGATVSTAMVNRVTMQRTDADQYTPLRVGDGAVVNSLTVQGSVFDNFSPSDFIFDSRSGATMNAMKFSGNRITNAMTGEAISIEAAGDGNSIDHNWITAKPGVPSGRPIRVHGQSDPALFNGWLILDNYFDGWSLPIILDSGLGGAGVTPVSRNRFGSNNIGGGTAADELNSNGPIFNGGTAANNHGVLPWVPTAVSVDSAQCQLTVTAVAPTPTGVGTVPETPVAINVFYTPTNKAEVYLGTLQEVTGTTANVVVPYSNAPGNIRLQITATDGASSQMGRTFPVTEEPTGCGPQSTLVLPEDQSRFTNTRDVRWFLTFNEETSRPMTADDFAAEIPGGGGSTQSVIQLDPYSYLMTVRANRTTDVIWKMDPGVITDLAGNGNAAPNLDRFTQTVLYANPLTIDTPSLRFVREGGSSASYGFINGRAAKAPVSIAPIPSPAEVTVDPSPVVIPSYTDRATAQITAVDNTIVDGRHGSNISHTVTSADPNLDGLELGQVSMTVLDNDTPSASQSTLVVAPGTGPPGTAQTATVTVRNADGGPVSGVTVDFSVNAPATVTASCVSDATGVCSVPVNSTTAGTFVAHAEIAGTEISGSPANVVFVAGAASAATSTIVVAPTSLVADGTSTATVTVTVKDALGNNLAGGGDTVALTTTAGTLSAVTDNGDGTYTATLTAPSSAGTGSVTVGFSVNGTTSPNTATVTLTAGPTTPPVAPVITGPTSGSTVGPSPTITGTGIAGNTVTVRDGTGATVCTATVAADGTWSCVPSTALPVGPVTITAIQTDPQGQQSPVSVSVTFTVSSRPLSLDVDPATVQRGETVTATGHGFVPGEVVSGQVSGAPGLGTVVAVASGDAVFTFVVPGSFELAVYTVTLTGADSGKVSGTFTVVASVPPDNGGGNSGGGNGGNGNSSGGNGSGNSGGRSNSLPPTGADINGMGLMAIAFVGVGTFMVVLDRRHRFVLPPKRRARYIAQHLA